jgi:hypothetical protein
VIKRSKGSHHYLVHASDPTRRTTIAVHPGDLPERDVHDILKQSRISREEFFETAIATNGPAPVCVASATEKEILVIARADSSKRLDRSAASALQMGGCHGRDRVQPG